MKKILKLWFISFILLTLVAGFVFITVQQSYRHSADDPQIQIAHDTALLLMNGGAFTSSKIVNIANEYAPFTIIYNRNGKVISSEAKLNGQTPELPQGVLDYTEKNGVDRLTWQPQPQIRIATVVERFKNGYVVVGRSLVEVEQREAQLEQQVALFWILSNIIMLAVITGAFFQKGNHE